MSIIPASVKCDGCGKSRDEDTNHWRSLSAARSSLSINEGIGTGYPFHVCGETCALKLLSRWLATGKLDAE